METLLKQPYEISLWDDRLTAVYEDGTESQEFVNAQENIIAQYYKEFKICTIGSNTMDSPFKVVEPKLERKTDGTSTLTFSIYTKNYNEETKEFEPNPFVNYLTNERKIKLKYFPKGQMAWLDFIIKKIDESSENYKITYTATDLFINELSKTGYNLEFDKELENGQGTVKELAEQILESTDWMVGEDSEIIQQLNDEPVYAITLSKALKAYDIFTNEEEEISAGKVIYAFYSSVQDPNPEYFQFIYNKDGIYNKDQNNIVYNVGNYYCDRGAINGSQEFYNGFRAEKYIRTQKSKYDKVLEKFVKVYENEGKEYYGYVNTQYFSPALVTNYVTNGDNIIYSSGWNQQKDGSIKNIMKPPITTELSDGQTRVFGIQYEQKNEENEENDKNTFLLNSGFRDNAEIIKEISTNQKFVFGIKGSSLETGERYRCRVCRFSKGDNNEYALKDELFNTDNIAPIKIETGEFDTYYFTNIEPKHSLSYKDLTDITQDQFGIFIDVIKENNELSEGTYFIEKVEFFQQFEGETQPKKEQTSTMGIILPSGCILTDDGTITEEIAASKIINTYYYYEPKDDISKPEEVQYAYVGEQNSAFKPVYDYNFEKVRNISKKETNRFDLLQTLSETFECWCRFDVWHDEDGRILLGKDYNTIINSGSAFSNEKIIYLGGDAYSYEDLIITGNIVENSYQPYQQLKFVTFHKRIGQKKNVGFKYGINLKSVSRSLDSNDIATKLIVKSNTNEFADGGSCNIALSKENPSGENFIYDFSYYIDRGFLNQDNLNNDLYYYESEENSSRKWIGLYYRLNSLNKERDQLITEQVGLVSQYAKYKSTYESAKLQNNATLDEIEELEDEYYDITEQEYSTPLTDDWSKNEKVAGIAYNIERLKTKQIQLKADYDKAIKEMENIDLRLKTLKTKLEDIETDTSNLIQDFESKYIRFIQEASWTSEDYTDNDLYYLDAETTLHKAARPKVSYTFNVIDLSQIEEYQDYSFDIGDISYVEDTEIFGWEYKNDIKTPRKEEIVVTEQAIFLDSPEKNTFKTQNYRTAFENLFKKLTASAQQLQFHSGEFQRAADVVDTNGNIAPSCLEDAFSNNAYMLSNAANQTVKWDEFGITTTDSTNPAEIVRITSGGMFLSEDGGEKWTTGITARGINAKTITTGVLNTGLVNIYNGAQKSFVWDSTGLNAYGKIKDGEYNYNNFIRFEHRGIYGLNTIEQVDLTDLEKIKANANFYIGIDGNAIFRGTVDAGSVGGWFIKNDKIYSQSDTGYTILKKDDDIALALGAESLNDLNTAKTQIWHDGSVKFGRNNDGTFNFEADKYGNVTVKGTIEANSVLSNSTIEGGEISGSIISGATITGTEFNNNNGSFSVTKEGYLTAKNGTIGGWNIEGNSLYSGLGDSTTKDGIIIKSKTAGAEVAIAAGVPANNKPDTTSYANFQVYYSGKLRIGHDGTNGTSDGNYAFVVSNEGKLTCSNVTITGAASSFAGNITASGGSIGSWSITSEGYLYNDGKGDSKHMVIKGTGDYAIAVGMTGKTAWNTAAFVVKHDGSIKATAGTIGGWKITSDSLQTSISSTESAPNQGAKLTSQGITPAVGDQGHLSFSDYYKVGWLDICKAVKYSINHGWQID